MSDRSLISTKETKLPWALLYAVLFRLNGRNYETQEAFGTLFGAWLPHESRDVHETRLNRCCVPV